MVTFLILPPLTVPMVAMTVWGWRRDQVLGCSLISRGMPELDLAPAGRCCPLYSGGESYLGSSLVDVFTPALRVVVVVAAPVNNKLRKT